MLKEKSLFCLEKLKKEITMSFEEIETSEAHILCIEDNIITFNCRDDIRIEERVMINEIECMIIDKNKKYKARSYKKMDIKYLNKKVSLLQLKNYFKKKLMERIEYAIKNEIILNDNIIEYLENDGGKIESKEIIPISKGNGVLNGSQQSAVDFLDQNISYKIIGPPGTGKTKTIVEMINKLLENNKKIIVCAPSNTALDNILKRFINSDFYKNKKTSFFRLGSQIKGEIFYNLESIVEEELSFITTEIEKLKIRKGKKREESIFSMIKDKKKRKVKKAKELQENTKLIFSTIFSLSKITGSFDYIIIDECYQSSEIEIILSTILASNFILVGDPYQLGPVEEKNINHKKLNIPEIILNEQYRMNELLIKFSNNYFYNNKITSNKKEFFSFYSSPILFIDTQERNFCDSEVNSSYVNVEEGNIILSILRCIELNAKEKNISLGIITPYSEQTKLVKNILRDYSSDIFSEIKISTVDSFQGGEKDIIILSLVRSNYKSEIGFLNEIRRINVAITRCKLGLVVIGDSLNFKEKFFKNLFNFLNTNGMVLDPSMLKEMIK